jgi:hypothetical protein
MKKMLIEMISKTVESLNGKQMQRCHYWNPIDDNPKLDHAKFKLTTNKGEVTINAYEAKKNVKWPDYPCVGDVFKNKFSVSLQSANKIIQITEFIDINDTNIQRFIGQFKETSLQ